MDAISFVLGVKTRHLRGKRLADLITRSTEDDARTPAKKARVSKTFVRLTYLWRGGERLVFQRQIDPHVDRTSSEYLVDGAAVGEGEYHAALERIGVFPSAKNFLVFQGDVAAVASKTGKELTRLFETISGSGELEEEYQRALDAKNAAEEHAIHAYQKKKGASAEKKEFKKMKEEADQYEELRAKCATLRLERVLCTLRHITRGIAKFRASTAALAEERAQAERACAAAEQALKSKRAEQASAHKERIKQEHEVARQQAAADELLHKYISAREGEEHVRRVRESLGGELAKARQESAANAELVAELERQHAELERAESALEDELAEASRGFVVLTEEQQHAYQTALARAQQELSQEELAVQPVVRERAECADALKRLRLHEAELVQRVSSLAESKGSLESRGAKVALFRDEVSAKLAAAEAAARRRREEYDAVRAELEGRVAELGQVNERLSRFKQEKAHAEREERFAAVVGTLQDLYPGRVLGRLSDACTPTAGKYKVSSALALGKYMDALVVDTAETARECVAYLKSQRVGLAVFLPVQDLEVQEVGDELRVALAGKKTARFAVDVIRCEEPFERALKFAVGTTVICESLDEARRLAFHTGARLRVVTVDGAVISKSGLITGGCSGLDGKAAKWDLKKLAALKTRRDALAAAVHVLRERVFAIESGGGEEGEGGEAAGADGLAALEARRAYAQQELDDVTARVRTCAQQLASAERELRACRSDIAAAAARCAELDERLAAFRERTSAVSRAAFASLSRELGVENVREVEERCVRQQAEGGERRAALSIALGKLESQLRFARHKAAGAAADALAASLAQADEAVERAARTTASCLSAADERRAGVERARAAAAELRESALALEGEAKALRHAYNERLECANAASHRLSAAESQLARLYGRRHDVFNKARIDHTLALPAPEEAGAGESGGGSGASRAALYRAEDAYPLDFAAVDRKYKVSSLAQYQALLEQFDRELAHYEGLLSTLAPNLKAGQQMEGARRREQEVGEQLEGARRESSDAAERFRRVQAERVRRFTAAFDRVSRGIDTVYKALTRTDEAPYGGQAYLTLENVAEPFSGGVQYTAMPPTKRFQEIGLLSGGERTMAALALLFAIHGVRPSPFFVLDEVDAALDGANVRQVVRYIREQSGAVQFLVISLKDALYSRADALVGITRDPATKSSETYTFDLTSFADHE